MKLIVSILIAGIFTLLGIMKSQGYFDLSIINLINLDGTFDIDLSFIKTFTDYILYIPELIYNSEKENIKGYISQYTLLTNNDIYIVVLFIYHFIATGIFLLFIKLLSGYNTKKYITLLLAVIYLILIYIVQTMTNL